MNNTTDTTPTEAPKAEAPGTDIASTLLRIAQALEKQNVLTEELANAINGVNHAIQDVGVNL